MMSASRPLATHAHKLSALLAGLAAVEARADRSILGLSLDSRKTRPGDLFLATKGAQQHGADFIAEALKAGAVAVAWDSSSMRADDMNMQRTRRGNVPMFGIENLRQQVGAIAARFHDHPARDMLVTGVTGTNGKTTVANLLAGVLHDAHAHAPCGVIGTLGYGLHGKTQPGAHTTPDALTLQWLLAEFRAQHVKSVVMEASSHGLEQGRVNAVPFHTAVFTNLSRDHLDYHSDMAAYAAAKRRLFFMPGLKCAVINSDDEYGRTLLQGLPAGLHTLSYGLVAPGVVPPATLSRPWLAQAAPQGLPHVRGTITRMDQHGLALEVSTPRGEGKLESALLGKFNASNLLAVLAVLLLMDMPLEEALQSLSKAKTVSGRMERFSGAAHQPTLVVDYAHTPDALRQVLQDLRAHLGNEAKLWCVFGCGGERDRGKRPLMGAMAEQYADYLVVTDDNPRNEDAVSIIADILSGMTNPDGAYIQRDRAQAIAFAAQHAASGDVVLIAGKGHEEYQIMGARKIPFSDRREVRHLLHLNGSGHSASKEQP